MAGVDEMDLVAFGLDLHRIFGIHSRSCKGSSEVWAPLTAAALSRVDSRATGSALSGFAMSSWNASQSDEHATAEPPVAAIRLLSIFDSLAFDRRNCTARAASSSGHFTGGLIPAAWAWVVNRSLEKNGRKLPRLACPSLRDRPSRVNVGHAYDSGGDWEIPRRPRSILRCRASRLHWRASASTRSRSRNWRNV
jgi:hypothetical protein